MIRKGQLPDVEKIVEYNYRMALETEDHELDKEVLRKGVTEAILDDAKASYYLYEEQGEVIAQMMITKEWSDWRGGCFWWIQSVYVAKPYRRNGVFRELYQYVKNLAENRDDVCGLRLYVEKENEIARTTYEKLGLDQTSYLMFECEI